MLVLSGSGPPGQALVEPKSAHAYVNRVAQPLCNSIQVDPVARTVEVLAARIRQCDKCEYSL